MATEPGKAYEICMLPEFHAGKKRAGTARPNPLPERGTGPEAISIFFK